MNWLQLCGAVNEAPVLSHWSHGLPFYRFWLQVNRLSGNHDRLRILASQKTIGELNLTPGEPVALEGQLRSFNNTSGSGSRLVISALAKEMMPGGEEHGNRVILGGTLCRVPSYRRTPLGREICDIMLAVPRAYNRSDYVPLIAWGQCARACAALGTGDFLRVEGRFQSRSYIKQGETQSEERTAFEVSVTRLLGEEESVLTLL